MSGAEERERVARSAGSRTAPMIAPSKRVASRRCITSTARPITNSITPPSSEGRACGRGMGGGSLGPPRIIRSRERPRADAPRYALLAVGVGLAAAWWVPSSRSAVVWPLLLVVPGWVVSALPPRIDAAGRLGLAIVDLGRRRRPTSCTGSATLARRLRTRRRVRRRGAPGHPDRLAAWRGDRPPRPGASGRVTRCARRRRAGGVRRHRPRRSACGG